MSTVAKESAPWQQVQDDGLSENTVLEVQGIIDRLVAQQAALPLEKHEGWFDFLADLNRWKSDPGLIDNGDNVIPSPDVFSKATAVGTKLFLNFRDSPTFVIPTSDGGIAFERHDGNVTEMIIVHPDASAEFIGVRDAAVFLRRPFHV